MKNPVFLDVITCERLRWDVRCCLDSSLQEQVATMRITLNGVQMLGASKFSSECVGHKMVTNDMNS